MRLSSAFGNCQRCGAPKAPIMVGNCEMVLCTRCTSLEDQRAILELGSALRFAEPENANAASR